MYSYEKVSLMPIREADIPFIDALRHDIQVANRLEPSSDWIVPRSEQTLKDDYLTDGGAWVVKDKNSLTRIGYCSIWYNGAGQVARPALALCKEAQHKGYGKDLLKCLIKMCFEIFPARKISIVVYGFNTNAIKLYEKAGFKHEAILKEEFWRAGNYHDVLYMAMFKKDYPIDIAGANFEETVKSDVK